MKFFNPILLSSFLAVYVSHIECSDNFHFGSLLAELKPKVASHAVDDLHSVVLVSQEMRSMIDEMLREESFATQVAIRFVSKTKDTVTAVRFLEGFWMKLKSLEISSEFLSAVAVRTQ